MAQPDRQLQDYWCVYAIWAPAGALQDCT